MKCSELLRMLKRDGWYVVSQKGSHMKFRHPVKPGMIVFPNHGSQEIGKGLEYKIMSNPQDPYWKGLPWKNKRD